MANKRAFERRADFIAAAQELFEEKGFENTSVDDIVAKLGVAKGLFYYYFESKEMLLDLIFEQMMNEIDSAIIYSMEKKGLSATERLAELFKSGSDVAYRSMTMIKYFHKERNRSLHLAMEKRAVELMAPALELIVRQGVEEGIFDTPYPKEAAGAILFMKIGMNALLPPEPPVDEIILINKALQHNVERILGAAPGSLIVFEELLPPEFRSRSESR